MIFSTIYETNLDFSIPIEEQKINETFVRYVVKF